MEVFVSIVLLKKNVADKSQIWLSYSLLAEFDNKEQKLQLEKKKTKPKCCSRNTNTLSGNIIQKN